MSEKICGVQVQPSFFKVKRLEPPLTPYFSTYVIIVCGCVLLLCYIFRILYYCII